MTAVYLDCNATTPLEDEVREVLLHYLTQEFGNEGSRTHDYGTRAKRAVATARDQVATLVQSKREEVLFTSGATESNNLAILGLRRAAEESGKRHVITTQIEHKAVLEPFDELERQGFEVTRLAPARDTGWVSAEQVATALRPDTFLVSVMHVNNETGIEQPIDAIAQTLAGHSAFLHTDAAQSFGKLVAPLQNPRLDLISISGHKVYAPKGIGALIARRRGFAMPPLRPLMFGGGQERGLRPGTLAVAQIAALGTAAAVAQRDAAKRAIACLKLREQAVAAFVSIGARFTGDAQRAVSHVLHLAIPGLDSEAMIVALKDLIAFSNGSACTSSSYTPSHVLKAMGFSDVEANECVRLSWSHLTPAVDWSAVTQRISAMR